ncbi:hypothetical protein MMC26_003581 [Xylographa opegraphella]|nr:hypothetical protein [Xylographa opegraphella]
MYYDQPTSRSPGAQRHQQQTLHRQPSRQFDAYGDMPPPMYPSVEHAPRYEMNRFDRMNASLQNGGYAYDHSGAQSWNPGAFGGGQTFNSFGTTGRLKATSRQRTAIPNTWLDPQVPPVPALPNLNTFGGLGHSQLAGLQHRQDTFGPEPDEELIPTAIVIKNIPFAVKKEQLVDIMTQMNLPLPYAFNYHFDNGVFRGLAFANFTSADETAVVIDHLNHFELQGRKLRVEYKKMLPLQERERIEREKRERRGQLEEQHRPMANTGLHNQQSMSSMSSHIPAASPSPVSSRNTKPEYDLHDPETREFYNELLFFKADVGREALIFPSSLAPSQRRIIHTLAHLLQLAHVSRGSGEQRQVHVFRALPGSNISPPILQGSTLQGDASRRSLNRSATTDFSEARASDLGIFNTLRGQQSTGFLGIPDSPNGFGAQQNLRAAKSFADLRSYTPSPVPSSASFPAALQSNIARFQEYGPGSIASNTPTLTPTASGTALGQQHRDENLLANGLGSMSLGGNLGPNGGSPRRLRGMFSWEQDSQGPPTGPIGSNRNFSMNTYDDQSRDRSQNIPTRQPRGPVMERGPGFSRGRQNGTHQSRGSDELRQSSSVEIIVE